MPRIEPQPVKTLGKPLETPWKPFGNLTDLDIPMDLVAAVYFFFKSCAALSLEVPIRRRKYVQY